MKTTLLDGRDIARGAYDLTGPASGIVVFMTDLPALLSGHRARRNRPAGS